MPEAAEHRIAFKSEWAFTYDTPPSEPVIITGVETKINDTGGFDVTVHYSGLKRDSVKTTVFPLAPPPPTPADWYADDDDAERVKGF